MAGSVLKIFSARCGIKTAALCLFGAFEKRRWARRGEKVSHNVVVVSSGSMISLFPCGSTARFGRFHWPTFSSDAAFLKALVLQELSNNGWSEMFSTEEGQAACVEEIALCKNCVQNYVNVFLKS